MIEAREGRGTYEVKGCVRGDLREGRSDQARRGNVYLWPDYC